MRHCACFMRTHTTCRLTSNIKFEAHAPCLVGSRPAVSTYIRQGSAFYAAFARGFGLASRMFAHLSREWQTIKVRIFCLHVRARAEERAICRAMLNRRLKEKRKVRRWDSNSRPHMTSHLKTRQSLIKSFSSFTHATIVIDMSK